VKLAGQMMRIAIVILLATSLAAADMPASFYQAMGNVGTEDTICVKNYDAGASFTESYRDLSTWIRRPRLSAALTIHPVTKRTTRGAMPHLR
jgi:hypothetical protein